MIPMYLICQVAPSFGDPVSGTPVLRKESGENGKTKNHFIGYYGVIRKDKDGTLRSHHGYDYVAENGTVVYAVGDGKIVQVRIGRIGKDCTCPFFNNKDNKEKREINNKFDGTVKGKCVDCKLNANCYGIQVWLELTIDGKKQYAFYAHLSELSESIFNVITRKDPIGNTYSGLTIPIKKEDVIGKSGCTGLASTNDENQRHLHFECRTAIEVDQTKRVQISPNSIVKTPFYVVKESGDKNKIIKEEITDELIGLTARKEELKKKWKEEWVRGNMFNKMFMEEWKKKKTEEWGKYESRWNQDSGNKMKNWESYIGKIKKEFKKEKQELFIPNETEYNKELIAVDKKFDEDAEKRWNKTLADEWRKLYTEKFHKQYEIKSGPDICSESAHGNLRPPSPKNLFELFDIHMV